MKRIIIFLSVLVFAYFIGSFISVSFDISKWAIEGRVIISVSGCFAAFAIATFPDIDKW